MKKVLTIVLSFVMVLILSGCSLTQQQQTTIDGQSVIDRSSIAADIYNQVHDKIERELYDEIYAALLEEFGDATITWETLQQQIFNVINGNGEANCSVTNYQRSTETGEIQAYSYGSGVICEKETLVDSEYSTRYWVITNEHVVEGGVKFAIGFKDGTKIDATLKGGDSTTDIALHYFDTNRVFEVAPLGNSDEVKQGEFVIAIGNPKGETLYGSTTFGIVSGTNRNLVDGNGTVTSYLFYIQHDAAINSGNSGGGLFNMKGEVIGINSVKYASESIEGLGFSIPINLVKDVISEIKEYGSYSGTVTFGVTVASVSSLNASGRKTYGVPDSITKGVVVISVAEGGSSDGVLQPNDIIIKTGNTPIEDSNDLALILQGKKIGDTLPLTVYRNGSYIDVVITFKRNTTN